MKSTERRKELLIWLEDEGTLSLGEMVDRFAVSKMTIHRDLDLLEQRQVLKRIHGGAARIEKLVRDREGRSLGRFEQGNCLLCSRSVSQQLVFALTLKNGQQQTACCPRCGLAAYLESADQVATVLSADFLSGKLHPAQQSSFIVGSVVEPCCQPSLLSFAEVEMAKRFQVGFGGDLADFEAALAYLTQRERAAH